MTADPKPNAPKPREVFLAACQTIAQSFAADGFTYVKSLPGFRRKSDEKTHVIEFQSSTLNAAGLHIALTAHISVRSKAIAEFRRANKSPFGADDFICGGELGNISPANAWAKYELAGSHSDTVINAIAVRLRAVALPFFELAANLEALEATLLEGPREGFAPCGFALVRRMVDYFLAAGRRESAQRIFTATLARHPGVAREAVDLLASGGETPNNRTREVVALVKTYGLVLPE